MKKIFFTLYILVSAMVLAQRPNPAPAQKNPIAITNATIHTATGTVLNNASLVFENGKITQINGIIPSNAEVINVQNKHVYPGFILVNNTLGLVEISATNATVDYREANDISPEVRSLISFNTDSHVIPVIRSNGVLLTQPVLKHGTLSCTSSIMQLDAWNWEDAVVATDNVLHLSWPEIFRIDDEKRNKEFQTRRTEKIKELTLLFQRAQQYDNQQVKDYKLNAIKPVFENRKLFVEVAGANETLEVIAWANKLNLRNVVLIGESNLVGVLDDIKKSNFPLIIKRVHSLPVNSSDSPRLPYEFAKLVQDKGILYGLDYSGDMEYQNSRNLPFLAGTTVAYGVEKEKALQSITINLAKMLGIDKNYGTLEVGKSATLFISEGDALDQLTNNVTEAFIDGRKINLDNQQKELYKTYQEKYRLNQ
ncbi:amidohydrolase [Cloacibacterium normanense]|uniref:Amidohydrolase n=1 Tax=Cloacibacterium normanense TaxID=237258 RepID=A0A2S7I859_9FLAO|nr:amidohydrolase family protein [Cloacibacterium normanense]PPZ92743.1 amidohydrolase [Cloacibacterium normanense]